MILRCQRSIVAEAISNNKLYPVIMYEQQKITHVRRFLIVDDYPPHTRDFSRE